MADRGRVREGDCASSEEEGHLLVTNLWSG